MLSASTFFIHRLERLVFGDPSDVIEKLKGSTEIQSKLGDEIDDEASIITEISTDGEDDESLILMKSDEESIISVDSKHSTKTPVWRDDDDDDLLYV